MKAFLIALGFILIQGAAFSQSTEKTHISIYGNLGFPIGEFRQSVNNSIGGNGVGIGMSALFNPKKEGYFSPVLIGLEANYLHLGTEKTPESTSLPRLKTSYNYVNFGPVIRALLSQREQGLIPFVDAFVGMKILNTKTRVDNTLVDTLLDREILAKLLSTNYEGLSYGLGVGFFQRKIWEDGVGQKSTFYLKLNYTYGDRLSYVQKGSIQVNPEGDISYQVGKTQTGLVSLQLGILLY